MLDTADIFTQKGNRKRVYALRSFTVRYTVGGWSFRKTDSSDKWCGPYSSEISVALMIARQLRKELQKRDGLPS